MKIVRRVNAQKITHANRKQRITRKIKKEIKAVRIHVRNCAEPIAARAHGVEPVLLDQVRQNKFVQKTHENFVNARVEVIDEIGARALMIPVPFKTAIAVNRSRRDGGKKQQERKILQRRQRFNQAVLNADDDVECAKADVRNSQKANQRL